MDVLAQSSRQAERTLRHAPQDRRQAQGLTPDVDRKASSDNRRFPARSARQRRNRSQNSRGGVSEGIGRDDKWPHKSWLVCTVFQRYITHYHARTGRYRNRSAPTGSGSFQPAARWRQGKKNRRGEIDQRTGRPTLKEETTEKVKELNAMLRGCGNYFSLGSVSKAYRAVDAHTRFRLRQWLR